MGDQSRRARLTASDRRVHFAVEGSIVGSVGELYVSFSELRVLVATSEPSTTTYDWYIDADSKRFWIEEEYTSSGAFIQHMRHLKSSGWLARLAKQIEADRVNVWASGDEEAKRLLDRLGATHLVPLDDWPPSNTD